jgi:integrase
MQISAKLNQANGRLKASKIGVAILRRGDRLYLQAVLPPRPGSSKLSFCQQQIALGIHANPPGISLAEKEARRLGYLRDAKEFDWDLYGGGGNIKQKSELIADWVQRFEELKRPRISGTTWKTDYFRPFSQLPAGELITPEILLSAIANTKPNTRQRRRFCLAFRQLADFAGIELDVRHLMGSYSATKVKARNLLTDEDILICYNKIQNPCWQWAYGAIATYGLRNHEVFYLDMSRFPIAQVQEGKTGYRQVWPLQPEWAEQWDLANIKLPSVTGKCHADFGMRVTKFFAKAAFGFNSYDLRHAWAVRAIRFGLTAPLAAKQMGHSLQVHTQTYHLALNEREQQQAYDLLVTRNKS